MPRPELQLSVALRHHDSRFVVMVASHGNGVPEGVDLGASVVHDPGQPGEDGGAGVTVTVVKGIRLDPAQETSISIRGKQ